MSKGVQIAIGAGLVAALLVWYGIAQVQENSFVYYQSLDEFISTPRTDRSARVHGFVANGSIERDVASRQVRFAIQHGPPGEKDADYGTLFVVYAGLETPDLFKDGVEVVVEGHLEVDGHFAATNVLAKCPSKFEGNSGAS